jgi:hypothetical protein
MNDYDFGWHVRIHQAKLKKRERLTRHILPT